MGAGVPQFALNRKGLYYYYNRNNGQLVAGDGFEFGTNVVGVGGWFAVPILSLNILQQPGRLCMVACVLLVPYALLHSDAYRLDYYRVSS